MLLNLNGLLIILLIVLNAWMDSIDHHKAEKTLGWTWHGIKWFSMLIIFYLIYICPVFTLAQFIGYIIIGLILWEPIYQGLRWYFKKYGCFDPTDSFEKLKRKIKIWQRLWR